jgi:LysR family transcriptional regulator of abg operon
VHLHIIEGVVYQSAEPALRDGRIDFYVGLAPAEPHGAGLIVQKLFENRRIVMGRVGHPLTAARSIRDLVNAEWASGNDQADLRIDEVFRSFSLKSPRIQATAESALSLIVLIAYSDMLALLPRQWAEFAPMRTLLQEIPVKEEISAPAITLVRRADMPLTPAAEHLCELLQAAARSDTESREAPKQRASRLARA